MHAVRLLLAAALAAAPLAVPSSAGAQHAAAPGADPLAPAAAGGLEVVDRALAKLESHRRLLIVGAHPDDEDNSLLAYVSRGLGGEAGYLSLSRGEGGQNLIGTELGVELGVVRTGELLAARRIEGTRQFFARAYDFGYTRSLEETFEKWPREVLLEDAVRAVRRFKPQVMVAIFPADGRAGHGQHQASGVVAREAFATAGDADRFGELAAAGLDPWQPEAFFQRAWSREQALVTFDLGGLDPLTGRSIGQVAAASRSQHRSQDMGREQRIGRYRGGVAWEVGPGGPDSGDLFAGIDTRLEAIAAVLGGDPRRDGVAAALRRAESLARATRGELSPTGLGGATGAIADIVCELDRGLALLSTNTAAERVVGDLLREKRAVAVTALTAAAGLVLEATVDREQAVPGATVAVALSIWPAGAAAVEPLSVGIGGVLDGLNLRAAPDDAEVSGDSGVITWSFAVELPESIGPTLDDHLERPRQGDLYDWSGIPETLRGQPIGELPLVASFDLRIDGVTVRLEREVVYRYGDQAWGEIRRPFRVVPPIEISVEPGLLLWPLAAGGPADLRVVLRSNTETGLSGTLRPTLPRGWVVSGQRAFTLAVGERELEMVLELEAPPDAKPGRFRLPIRAELADGSSWDLATPVLEYPHIRPAPVPRAAEVEVSVLDLELPAIGRIGYVVGASDRVPAVLEALGLAVEILSADDLLRGELGGFDTIVVGSRAYEIDSALAAANGRLLEFARAGGTLVVQYQQYQFVRGDYAPFPLGIGRPHGRVTDETADVRLLAPDHRIFHSPNRIAPVDWNGWVQERGLYFASEWADSYQPLLAVADPGREEEQGVLLVAALGEGTYVYTGLSFFRQLPVGVPGAIRLLVNLLGLGR